MTEFQLGDKVMYAGMEGVVEEVCSDALKCVFIDVDGDRITEIFLLDGKISEYHKAPLLTLIERPKKKRVVKMAPALCRYLTGYFVTGNVYESEERAKGVEGIYFIRLLWDRAVEIEVEE